MREPAMDERMRGAPDAGLRSWFPALADGNLVYLDSAATTQRPERVLEAVRRFQIESCANVHRAVYELGLRATHAYEGARATMRDFVGAGDAHEVLFVRGTTEGINLIAAAYARPLLRPGDRVVVSELEHHSNLVPWQLACAASGAELVPVPVRDDGDLDLDALRVLLDRRTRIVACAYVSNALGTVLPVAEIAALAHAAGAVLVVDAAQAAAHVPIDVRALGCDFLALSGHKMYGPTGIGIVWGRRELLEQMPPWQGGGEMIEEVRFAGTTYAAPPHRFEAGTPNTEGAVGIAEAARFLREVGFDWIERHEQALLAHLVARLHALPGVRVLGAPARRAALVSFTVADRDAHELAILLDQAGVAVRSGHHCAQPLLARFGVEAALRISLGVYTERQEIDVACDALAALL